MEKLDRKDFLKLAGGTIAGAAVGTTLTGAPFLSAQWLVEWTQDQFAPPGGEEKFINSIYGPYPDGTDITVRMFKDRAVKIQSSQENADAQLALQLLYHPERIKTPLKNTGRKGHGRFREVSWEEALNDISSKLNELSADKNAAIAAIDSGKGGLSSILMKRLISSAGSPNFYSDSTFDVLSAEVVKLTQNSEGSIHYDLENSGYILSFGARIVEGWGNSARINKAFKTWKENGTKLIHIDSISTRTASLADRWIPVKPGTESILALGIANQLINMGRNSGGSNFGKWSQIIINQYTPDKVSKLTGVPASEIKKLAEEFGSASRPVAVAGRGSCEISSSSAEIAAVQCLNSLVGAIGNRGGAFIKTASSLGNDQKPAGTSRGLDDYIKNGACFELLFINESNPVHKSVYGKDLIEKMKKAMVVSIMPLINDTAMYSDYILPSLSILEIENPKGEKVVAPRYKSAFSGDIIINIAKKTRLNGSFPWKNYSEAVKAIRTGALKSSGFSFPADLFNDYLTQITARTTGTDEYPLALIPFSLVHVGDGSRLSCPYVLKGIDNTILLKNRLWVHMNPETADKYGINEGSCIDIESKKGVIENLYVHLTKTIAPDAIAVPLGFGQTANTKYAADKGVNPKEIMYDDIDQTSGVADWWLTMVKIS